MKRLSFAVLFCLLLSSLTMNAASPVVISEFMSSNFRNLRDETGQYPDWIEIQNVSSNTVNLLNWSLTDSDNNLTKWRFPETNLNAGAFMVIYAASPEQRVPGLPCARAFHYRRTASTWRWWIRTASLPPNTLRIFRRLRMFRLVWHG